MQRKLIVSLYNVTALKHILKNILSLELPVKQGSKLSIDMVLFSHFSPLPPFLRLLCSDDFLSNLGDVEGIRDFRVVQNVESWT